MGWKKRPQRERIPDQREEVYPEMKRAKIGKPLGEKPVGCPGKQLPLLFRGQGQKPIGMSSETPNCGKTKLSGLEHTTVRVWKENHRVFQRNSV